MIQESMNLCPNMVSQGVCDDQGCRHNHTLRFCSLCKTVCPHEIALKAHLNGKKHAERVKCQNIHYESFCKFCTVTMPSLSEFLQHIRGKRHRRAAGQQTETTQAQQPEPELPLDFVFCEPCDQILPLEDESRHQRSNAHNTKLRFFTIQAQAEQDKNGISVKGQLDFGSIEATDASLKHTMSIEVTSTQDNVEISEIRLSSNRTTVPRTSYFTFQSSELPLSLIPDVPEWVTVIFDSQGLPGRHNDRIEIVFFDPTADKKFVITRSIRAIVRNQADWELLKPSAPYKQVRKKAQTPERAVLPGIKPSPVAKMEKGISLPETAIPKSLENALNLGDQNQVIKSLRSRWLPKNFNSGTHGAFFKVLLHAEEVQLKTDIQRYDMEDVEMKPVNSYYRLSIPGLAEKRPSVIIGDRILVQYKGSEASDSWFEGYVHSVHQTDVDLRFHTTFRGSKGQRYNVRFKLNRLPLRRMHNALSTPFASQQVLFPSKASIKDRLPLSDEYITEIGAWDENIQSNPQQLLAVATILHMPPGSIPFVVFGPPGTGKTVTVVEAIRQILSANRDARILACAPSNSAADLFVDRLKDNLTVSQMFRLNAPSRPKGAVSKTVMSYSRFGSNGIFSTPLVAELKTFRVVVSTCISSFHLSKLGKGHFSHIFIDEAGQASEPEVMVPIRMIGDIKTNIVLSGDPKQLGPIVRSQVAASLGLEKSYLDRLMDMEAYEPNNGNGVSVVKLIKNFRSHPAILTYPNELFYDNELEAHGNERITHSLSSSDELVTPNFPIIFHAIIGRDMREAASPSFFNPEEASVIRGYVERLRKDKRIKLQDTEIGVIAPYHAQVTKIRKLLQKSGYAGVKVGSVEEFQGQERRVIIVSTVRSSMEYVGFDLRHTLGFVANPRRFNVTVTRAQALLIVVGDPTVLSLDPLWRGFMNYIYLNDGWRGVQPDWDPTEPVTEEDYGAMRRKFALEDLQGLMGEFQG